MGESQCGNSEPVPKEKVRQAEAENRLARSRYLPDSLQEKANLAQAHIDNMISYGVDATNWDDLALQGLRESVPSVATPSGDLLNLQVLSGRCAGHAFRQAIRANLWAQVARRQLWFLEGLDPALGINLDATLALLKCTSSEGLSCYERGVLRSILTGGVRPQTRLHAAGLVDSLLCPLCTQCPGTLGSPEAPDGPWQLPAHGSWPGRP